MQFEQGTIVTHENGVRASGIRVSPAGAPCDGLTPFCHATTNRLRMPILPSEPDIFPAELLDGLEAVQASDAQWWAMYTMARREKELMRRLRALEIPFYSLLVTQWWNCRTTKWLNFITIIPFIKKLINICITLKI